MDANWLEQLDSALQNVGVQLREVRNTKQNKGVQERLDIALMHCANAKKMVLNALEEKRKMRARFERSEEEVEG